MQEGIRDIIGSTLEILELDSEEASSLIYRTGMAESGYRALKQRGGPALGFFQCEPNTAVDIFDNYVMYRPKYRDKLFQLGFDDAKLKFCLLSNIALQVAFCRLHYRRVPSRLPGANDIEAQAKYWKTFYNTVKGKGTTKHFIEANK